MHDALIFAMWVGFGCLSGFLASVIIFTHPGGGK